MKKRTSNCLIEVSHAQVTNDLYLNNRYITNLTFKLHLIINELTDLNFNFLN